MRRESMEVRELPVEYQSWRRWSNHFEKPDLDQFQFDMEDNEVECENCGETTWDLVEMVYQCRACGSVMQEEMPMTPRDMNLRFSTRCSRIYYEEIDDASSEEVEWDCISDSADEQLLDDIPKHDKWEEQRDESRRLRDPSPNPRRFSLNRMSSHHSRKHSRQSDFRRSVQSVPLEPPKPRHRPWFETSDSHTIQFKLTPRGKQVSTTSASAATTASSGSPSGKGLGGGIPLGEEAESWQRMLASAIFLLPQAPRGDRPQTFDVGLLSQKLPGRESWSIKSQSQMTEGDLGMADEHGQTVDAPKKKVMWRVSLKPKD